MLNIAIVQGALANLDYLKPNMSKLSNLDKLGKFCFFEA